MKLQPPSGSPAANWRLTIALFIACSLGAFNCLLPNVVEVKAITLSANQSNLEQSNSRKITTLLSANATARPKLTLQASDKSLMSASQRVGAVNGTTTDQLSMEASIFRPSFLKGLLGGSKKTESSEPAEEQEEEVTQTIVMPLGGSGSPSGGESESENDGDNDNETEGGGANAAGSANDEDESTGDGDESSAANSKQSSPMKSPQDSIKYLTANSRNPTISLSALQSKLERQPKPEASLQLTSTEMSSLLNDREAPEFYRERELNGDGVLVGEERELSRAASGERFAPGDSSYLGRNQHYPFGSAGGSMGAYSGEADPLLNQRLLHAASEDFDRGSSGDGRGFANRFGEQAAMGFNGGESGFGRLMQSPNEFNEATMHGYGGAGGSSMDYGSHSGSGLMRAGSGDYLAGPAAAQWGSGGFPIETPTLERHASELYGAGRGAYMGQGPSEFNSAYNNRYLSSAGSHLSEWSGSGGFGGGQPQSGPADEFSSRFGYSTGGGQMFEPRGFAATRSSMMMPAGDSQRLSGRATGNLVPLSPIVPVADELREASEEFKSEEQLDGGQARLAYPSRGRQAQPQVHEALEEADEAEGGESEGGSAGSQTADNDEADGFASNSAAAQEIRSKSEGPSVVLNVPPPNIDAAASSYRQPIGVEFERIGSAGYLPPEFAATNDQRSFASKVKSKRLIRKMLSGQPQSEPQFSREYLSQTTDTSSNDPANNPAHAGKYIID